MRVRVVDEKLYAIPFIAGASSIASLLGYFYGLVPMRTGVITLLVPGIVGLVVFLIAMKRSGRHDVADRVVAGLFAGGVATFAYDLCRVPLAHAGLPIFKAISYFGALIVGEEAGPRAAEVAGWAYHYSNGVGFAVMYAALAMRDRLWSAVLWGVALEASMLATPYAEVFGYTRGREFVAITLGAHIVYGVGLWAGLRSWAWWRREPRRLIVGFAAPMILVGLIGADFRRIHGERLPPPPPVSLDGTLYTTWNVLEVDRVVVLWLTKRFHDPKARFALLPPFTRTPYGKPIDVPDGEIRRDSTRSAAEVALDVYGLKGDPRLAQLGGIATHFEIMPWRSPPPGATELGARLRDHVAACGPAPTESCLAPPFAELDAWYKGREDTR